VNLHKQVTIAVRRDVRNRRVTPLPATQQRMVYDPLAVQVQNNKNASANCIKHFRRPKRFSRQTSFKLKENNKIIYFEKDVLIIK